MNITELNKYTISRRTNVLGKEILKLEGDVYNDTNVNRASL